jgi:hypothetical protein
LLSRWWREEMVVVPIGMYYLLLPSICWILSTEWGWAWDWDWMSSRHLNLVLLFLSILILND